MRIGILETDKLGQELITTYGSYADMFMKLLQQVDPGLEFNVYQTVDGQYPADVDENDAYLITGSKSSVYENEEWIRDLEYYILLLHQYRKKLIGICFGHQLIAQAFGAKVSKSDSGWGVGNMTMAIHHTNWMDADTREITMLYSHQDQVCELPEEAMLITGNDFCPVAGFQIDSHILTFQGHPEFTPEYARNRLDFRRAKVGENTYQTAVESLQYKNDAAVVARWMLAFFRI